MHCTVIIIMYSLMCYFSKLVHTAHYKTKNQDSQETSVSAHTCMHACMHTHTHTQTLLQDSDYKNCIGFPLQNTSNTKLHACAFMLYMVLGLPTSLNCYMSTLCPVCFTPLLILTCSSSNNANGRLTTFALFPTLDRTHYCGSLPLDLRHCWTLVFFKQS